MGILRTHMGHLQEVNGLAFQVRVPPDTLGRSNSQTFADPYGSLTYSHGN